LATVATKVAAYEVRAQVDWRRLASRGEHVAVVDVQHVGPYLDPRGPARMLLGMHPVRGSGAPVEETRRRQHEGAAAQRRDAHPALVPGSQRTEEPGVGVGAGVLDRRNDDQLRPRDLVVHASRKVRRPQVRPPSTVQTTTSYHSPIGERSERSTPV
jgi:hypothetical protein